MAPSSTTLLSGASLGLSACIIMQTMSRAWRTRQSTEREVSSKFVSEILPRMEIFREYEKHCAAKGLHYTDAFKRPSHAQDDMDRRAEEAMNTVSSFWEMATEYSKYGLLPKNFLKDEKWKERARNYMDVVEPLEKADYERSSFAAEYGAYHEKDNRPQQFAYIEKL